jgi:ADP-ribose pyrophosphatase YjhB (NUDIX family)
MPHAKPTDRHIEVIARGLFTRGQWVLVCRNLKAGYCYLPGGHVEFGEPAAAALTRELEEETGLKIESGRCLLVTEGFFADRKREHHEVNLVFHVEHLRGARGGTDEWEGAGPSSGPSLGPPPPVPSLESKIAFEWIDIASLIGIDLRPQAIKAWLMAGGTTAAAEACAWASAFQS